MFFYLRVGRTREGNPADQAEVVQVGDKRPSTRQQPAKTALLRELWSPASAAAGYAVLDRVGPARSFASLASAPFVESEDHYQETATLEQSPIAMSAELLYEKSMY